ncbi:helix-turn-helix transcriptional regulator [Sphingobacterium spiritivorum]|uniref:helix-turn-helix transcriptional regulator n=1 Tax=Sphingobacterium TaxID=28453 RepID=UPI0025D10114|nr:MULTISPECIES: YafY family protein [unclassified Sphingobacterium]
MNDDSPKKFDRTVAILIQLQSKRVVKAQELADRFNVSLRTIYRDIRTLEASGVPIFGEAGTGYSLMEGYRLPPIMFTREEATSFVAAEKLMQQYVDQGIQEHFSSAIIKIKAVLKSMEKDLLSNLESQVLIQSNNKNLNTLVPNALSVLFESISRKKKVRMHYQTIENEHPETRVIEPVGIFHENKFWYMIAYCYLRKAYRQFRTDRIQRLEALEDAFDIEHPAISEFLHKRQDVEKRKVVILMDAKIAKYLVWQRDAYGFISEERVEGGKVRLTFMTAYMCEDFARWFMMFADVAEIEEPPELKVRVHELTFKAMENLTQLNENIHNELL